MSDRSLDEFVSASRDATGESDDAPADTADDAPADEESVDPATPTMRWSTDPVACDACGTPVSRRWQAGESFVCPGCKEW